MKYALLGDVHANLPALEAVLADLDARDDIDAVFHLGDLVGYGAWPNEVTGEIARRGICGVSGNYDSTIAFNYEHCGCQYDTERERDLASESFQWTLGAVSGETRRSLKRLPFAQRLRVDGGHGEGPTIHLFHGTPLRNTIYWSADRSDEFARRMIRAAGAVPGDILCFGHTHRSWAKQVDRVQLVNAGSVGRPKDGDWRAEYTVVEHRGDVTEVEAVRVAYDVERAIAGNAAAGLPAEFGEHLRRGGGSGEDNGLPNGS